MTKACLPDKASSSSSRSALPCKLLIATNNKGKLREYCSLLSGIPFELVSLDDVGMEDVPEETGETMEENARIKATAAAAKSGLLTLADDSGLEVDALGGEPGVRSARYAGENATDADRVQFLLAKLSDVPMSRRSARFLCVIAVSTPSGEVSVVEGECGGVIAMAPVGQHGFGYDPVFIVPELGKTMAELSAEDKDRISHRAKAAARVPEVLSRHPFCCDSHG